MPDHVMEIFDSPPKVDKRKGLAIPESLGLREGASVAAEAARQFVREQARRSEPMREDALGASEFDIEVSASLKGLNARFEPNNLVATHVRVCKVEFACIGVDLRGPSTA